MSYPRTTEDIWRLRLRSVILAACAFLVLSAPLLGAAPPVVGATLQFVENGAPVSGAWVNIRYYQLVTDTKGRIYVELPAGEYTVEIQRGTGSPTIITMIEVVQDQSEVVIELEGRETRPEDPEVPQILVFARFDVAGSLVPFWTDQADTLRQIFGDIAAAVLADGGYAVIKNGPPLQQAQEIARLTARARDAGFASSFTASKDAVAAVLVKSGELDQNVITETLIQLLESEDAGVRRNARTALSALGPVVVPQLIDTVSGQSYRKDLGGMIALGGINNWSAQPEVIERLWKVANGYENDRVMQSALRDVLNAASADAKLEFLGHESVRAFQQQTGLTPDGMAGRRTLIKLNDELYAKLNRQSGIEWAGYKMGIYALNIDDNTYAEVRDLAGQKGAKTRGALLSHRTTWLALHSTILYYDEGVRDTALSIAKALGDELGLEFNLQRGAGLGVQAGEEEITFFVHIIGKGE